MPRRHPGFRRAASVLRRLAWIGALLASVTARIRFGADQLAIRVPAKSRSVVHTSASTFQASVSTCASLIEPFLRATVSVNAISACGRSADRAATGKTVIPAISAPTIGCNSGRFSPKSMRRRASATTRSVVTNAMARAAARVAPELHARAAAMRIAASTTSALAGGFTGSGLVASAQTPRSTSRRDRPHRTPIAPRRRRPGRVFARDLPPAPALRRVGPDRRS